MVGIFIYKEVGSYFLRPYLSKIYGLNQLALVSHQEFDSLQLLLLSYCQHLSNKFEIYY